MIINHTDCGMLTFKDEELDAKLQKLTGTAVVAPARFYSFTDQAAADGHRGHAFYSEYVMTDLYDMLESDSLMIERYDLLFEGETHSH